MPAFHASEVALLRKKAALKGMWVRLRRRCDGVQLWGGIFCYSKGCTKEVHATEVSQFLRVLPPTTLPVIMGEDANTPYKWIRDMEEEVLPVPGQGKGDRMLTSLAEKGLVLTPPSQWSTPIDVVGCKHARATKAVIHEGFYMWVWPRR